MSDIRHWGVKETCETLKDIEFQCYEKIFTDNSLTAKKLQLLTIVELGSKGIEKQEDCLKILKHFRKLWEMGVPGKVFYDPIHGHLEFHPLLVKIIDTPQFQRLRNIKQLGGAYFVFPGASHSRFEHSLGVSYLARQLAEALRTKQPDLKITPQDILCVQIAGLCHELGRGPFSTVFEEMFIPEKHPDHAWTHEKISADMFDHLVRDNGLEDLMKQYDLNTEDENENDLEFIKEMIREPLKTDGQWPYKGRKKEKSFLYDIVANEKNGIDVDKFDYIARDCYYLGIPSSFDYRRCLMFARVCKVDEQNHICFRDKDVGNLYNMFHTRSFLHRTAYQHKATKIIEIMIKDALLKADEHIQIEGSGRKMFTLSTAINDMKAYTKLTDCVFEKILYWPDWMINMLKKELNADASILFKDSGISPTKEQMEIYKKMRENILKEAIKSSSKDMDEAKMLLSRILSRQIYKYLGRRESEKPTKALIEDWKDQLVQARPPSDKPEIAIIPNNFEIVHSTMDFGIKGKELIKNIFFYKKSDPNKPFNIHEDEMSMLLPKQSSEQFIRVYYKNTDDEVVETAQKHFDEWCRNPLRQEGDSDTGSGNEAEDLK